jgi:hypothetical protein
MASDTMTPPEVIHVTHPEYPDGAVGKGVHSEEVEGSTAYVLKGRYDALFLKAVYYQREMRRLQTKLALHRQGDTHEREGSG